MSRLRIRRLTSPLYNVSSPLSVPRRKTRLMNQCVGLIKAPSKLSATTYPGAKTRYDDFVAIHIKNTMSIHNTGNFLSWHRYFTYAYEQALIKECGYTGTQPVSYLACISREPCMLIRMASTGIGVGGHRAPRHLPSLMAVKRASAARARK